MAALSASSLHSLLDLATTCRATPKETQDLPAKLLSHALPPPVPKMRHPGAQHRAEVLLQGLETVNRSDMCASQRGIELDPLPVFPVHDVITGLKAHARARLGLASDFQLAVKVKVGLDRPPVQCM